MRGIEYLENDGMQIEAELHWYEHPKMGKIEFKLKDEEDDC